MSLLCYQLTAARALCGPRVPVGSVTVLLDACRSEAGLITSAVKGSDLDK